MCLSPFKSSSYAASKNFLIPPLPPFFFLNLNKLVMQHVYNRYFISVNDINCSFIPPIPLKKLKYLFPNVIIELVKDLVWVYKCTYDNHAYTWNTINDDNIILFFKQMELAL